MLRIMNPDMLKQLMEAKAAAAGDQAPPGGPGGTLPNQDPSSGGPTGPNPTDPDGDGDNDQDPSQDDDSDSGGSKIDPKNAGYMGPEMGPFQCSNCQFFDNGGSCQVVAGPIDPNGCCNNFTSQASGASNSDASDSDQAIPSDSQAYTTQ